MSSYKIEVQTIGNGNAWSGNGMRYASQEQAEAAARDLMQRWTLVTDWRVVPSDEPVTVL